MCFNIFNLNNALWISVQKRGGDIRQFPPFLQRSPPKLIVIKKFLLKKVPDENMAVGGGSIHFLDSTVTERIIITELLRILQIFSQGMISGSQLLKSI